MELPFSPLNQWVYLSIATSRVSGNNWNSKAYFKKPGGALTEWASFSNHNATVGDWGVARFGVMANSPGFSGRVGACSVYSFENPDFSDVIYPPDVLEPGTQRTWYVNPATGNDNNDGTSIQKAWQTAAKVTAESANCGFFSADSFLSGDRVVIDTGSAELDLQGQTLKFATPGLNVNSPDRSAWIRIKAHKRLLPSGWVSLGGGVYSTTDTVSLGFNAPCVWEDDKWMNHPNGSTYASVAAALASTPGSFWTNGTTLYVHPFGNTDPRVDGKAYDRTNVVSGVEMNAPNMRVQNIRCGKTCDLSPVNGTANAGYALSAISDFGGISEIRNCYTFYGGKHNFSLVADATNSDVSVIDCQSEQCSPYGSPNPWVAFMARPDSSGNIHRYIRCTTVAAAGEIGSTAGIGIGGAVYFMHNNGVGTQWADVQFIDCNFSKGVITFGSSAVATVAGGTVGDIQNYSPTLNLNRVHLDYKGVDIRTTNPCVFTMRNSIVTPVSPIVTGKWNGFLLRSTVVMEANTFDLTGIPSAESPNSPLLNRAGPLNLVFRNNAFTVGAGRDLTLLGNAGSSDTLNLSSNGYELGGSAKVAYRYNDGVTTADRTLGAWQGLGFDAGSFNRSANGLAAAASQPGGPLIGVGLNLGAMEDFTGRTYQNRDEIGAVQRLPNSFLRWRQQKFPVTDGPGGGLTGPGDSYSGDGVTNLMRYALALEPDWDSAGRMPAAGFLPPAGGSGPYLTLTYTRLRYSTDIGYRVEESPDLVVWNAVPASGEDVLASDIDMATVRARIPMDGSTRKFLRLRVKQRPAVVITAPADGATVGHGTAVAFSGTANDAVEGNLSPGLGWSSNIDGLLGNGGSIFTGSLSMGTHTITASVADSGGLQASAAVNITVADLTPPVLTVPAAIVAEATGANGAIVTFPASALDNVSGVVPAVAVPASGSLFPIGVTTVTATAVDGAGNVGSASFTVTVRDTVAPVVNVPANMVQEAVSSAGATVSYSVGATDGGSGVAAVTSSPTSGSVFPLGVTTVNVSATDASGNVGTGSFTVTVRDTTAPVVTVPGNTIVEATGVAGAVVTYAASADDLVDGGVTVTGNPASGSVFPLGVTTVNVSATDAAGNVGNAAFAVTVTDTTPPVITVGNPGPLTHEAGTAFVDPGAVATDAVAGMVGLSSSTSVNGMVPGVYALTYQYTDAAGNAAAAVSVTVNVVPAMMPPLSSSLVLDLESTHGVTAPGGNVTAWMDRSGRQNHLSAAGNPQWGAVQTPTGRPAISVNGNGDKLDRTGALNGLPAGNAERTMFVVGKYNSSTAWAGVAYGTAASNQAFGLYIKHPTGELGLHGYGGGNDLISTTPGIGAGWLVQSGVVQGGKGTLFKDGTQIAEFTHNYNTVLSRLVIGQEMGNLGYVGMDVAAVLIYNRALSPVERATVDDYLRHRYLAPGVPNAPPTVAISAPAPGTSIPAGETLAFSAAATDAQDNSGVLTQSIVWNSNRDGVIGIGGSLSASLLSTGVHTITASVFDTHGAPASASVTVTVLPAVAPPLSSALVLHLDSTQGVSASGQNVSSWSDQSGRLNHVVAGGNPRWGAVQTPAGRPAITLNGISDKLDKIGGLAGLPTGNSDRTMFVVGKYNSSTAWAGVAYGTGASNQAFGLYIKHPTGELGLHGYGGGNDLISTTPGIGAGWLVQSGLVASGTATLFKDGTQIAQFAHNYNTVLSKLVIGVEMANFGYVGMDVAAVLVYDRALTPAERASVEAYLRDKYF
ncbi:MAG: HYR domain-containing protein [Chthoniobacteraceae bacterium]